jgi:hypothetical protein
MVYGKVAENLRATLISTDLITCHLNFHRYFVETDIFAMPIFCQQQYFVETVIFAMPPPYASGTSRRREPRSPPGTLRPRTTSRTATGTVFPWHAARGFCTHYEKKKNRLPFSKTYV